MSLYSSLPNIMGGGGGGGNNAGGVDNLNNGEDMVAWDPEQSTAVNNPLSPMMGAPPDGGGLDANNKSYQFVSSNLQPVGIIDLECYSAVNRSKLNPTVLELAGDSVTNPDLRSFYFQSPSIEDAESWTKALLTDRHQSLKDETEAYRQVCESFPLQLANCSQMIDSAEAKADAMEREAYSVRSASEEGRRKVVSAVREMLERKCWETKEGRNKNTKNGSKSPFGDDPFRKKRGGGLEFEERTKKEEKDALLDSVLDKHFEKLETNRTAFLRELEAALSSPSAVATSNVVPPVQTLVDYTSAIISSFGDLRTQLQKVEMDLSTSVKQDQTQLEELKGAIEGRNAQLADAERKHNRVTSDLKSELDASRQQVEELTKQMEAQRMEFGMYQNSTKTKLSELGQHKKILKREVIELRKQIDEAGSENTTVAHEYEKIKSSYQAMKDKNATLERYIDRLEKQVGVQQNMMEMMSQTGGASLIGKIVGQEVTQTDSKDAVSLSGVSMGSQLRRANSMEGMNAQSRDAKSSSTPIRHRPLLPPEFSKGRNVSDVSPLPTPTFQENNQGNDNVKSLDQIAGDINNREDDRDPSTAYHRSETPSTKDSASPGSTNNSDNNIGGDAGPSYESPQRNPSRRPSSNDDGGDLENAGSSDPIISNRSAEEYISPKTPHTPDHKEETRSLRAAGSETPIQSNSCDDRYLVGREGDDDIVKSPTLDSGAEMTLNVNASKEEMMFKNAAPPAIGTADLEDDDMDDNVSRVSDITEDRTQRQIDDDLAERRKILLAYVNKTNGGSSSMSLSNASAQRRLETIENMLPSTREDIESNASESREGSSKLSVAQRARLAADSNSNSHRSHSPTPAQMQMKKSESSETSINHNSASSVGTPSHSIARSGSFLKSLGKSIEKALDSSVLGVNLPADDYEGSEYYDESESEIQSSVVSEASVSFV